MEKKTVTFNSQSSIMADETGRTKKGETKKEKIRLTSTLDLKGSRVKRNKDKKTLQEDKPEKFSKNLYVDECDLDDMTVLNATTKPRGGFLGITLHDMFQMKF